MPIPIIIPKVVRVIVIMPSHSESVFCVSDFFPAVFVVFFVFSEVVFVVDVFPSSGFFTTGVPMVGVLFLGAVEVVGFVVAVLVVEGVGFVVVGVLLGFVVLPRALDARFPVFWMWMLLSEISHFSAHCVVFSTTNVIEAFVSLPPEETITDNTKSPRGVLTTFWEISLLIVNRGACLTKLTKLIEKSLFSSEISFFILSISHCCLYRLK